MNRVQDSLFDISILAALRMNKFIIFFHVWDLQYYTVDENEIILNHIIASKSRLDSMIFKARKFKYKFRAEFFYPQCNLQFDRDM